MAEPQRVLTELPVHTYPAQPDGYRLSIAGLTQRPLSLDLDDLRALAGAAIDEDFTCLEGWVVPGQQWTGVPLEAVLRIAAPLDGARWVNASFGGFLLALPIDRVPDALLALSLNGALLTPEHGAPVRLIVRGGECFTSVKWVDHLRLSTEPAENTAERIARARLAK